jgi:hypothetical protein
MDPLNYVLEVISDGGYTDSPPCTLDDALAVAKQTRLDFAGTPGFIGVRIINLVFATQW